MNMVFIQERESKGNKYLYLDKSMRIRDKVFKVSKYLGKKDDFTKAGIREEIKRFEPEADKKILSLIVEKAHKQYKLAYPISLEEIRKIEEMNLKYREIRRSLSRKDWEDIKLRFVANFVFESNALEGNSLTLKNFADIIFENRVSNSADLREVYDARNSYAVFSNLLTLRREITESFIIDLHKKIVKNIDSRTGYKKIPNLLLGIDVKLTAPENVAQEMKKLLKWYDENKAKMYPLELAFRFHHMFECIHPFSDGNGRVGRMLLNYILIKNGNFPIIIRKTQRAKYLKALQAADHNQLIPLMRFALAKTKETYSKFFGVYYKYILK